MRALRCLPALALILSVACAADRVTDPLLANSGAAGEPLPGEQADADVTIDGMYSGYKLMVRQPGDEDATAIALEGPKVNDMAIGDGLDVTVRGKWLDACTFWVDSFKIPE